MISDDSFWSCRRSYPSARPAYEIRTLDDSCYGLTLRAFDDIDLFQVFG